MLYYFMVTITLFICLVAAITNPAALILAVPLLLGVLLLRDEYDAED